MIIRRVILFCTILVIVACCSSGNKDKYFEYPLTVRSNFTDDSKWEDISEQINSLDKNSGYSAHTSLINDKEFKKKDHLFIKQYLAQEEYDHSFFFVVDEYTISSDSNYILCVSMDSLEIDSFRFLPKDSWIIENNLSTANLLFEEMLYSVDKNGIFR